MEKKYAILLVRVSTEAQFYEAQISDLKDFAQKKGYTDFEIFSSKETGFADYEKKIGTNEVFQFIKDNPQYDTIFITEMSRLGRRSSVLNGVGEYLVSNKIQLYIKDTTFELLDINKEVLGSNVMLFQMYAMFSEAEMKQKADRFKRKKKELLENGDSAGGKVLFGYDRVPKGNTKKNTYIKNDIQAEQIRTIYDWYLNGIDKTNKNPSLIKITLECIKRGFHPYTSSKRNVNKLLKEEGYTGVKITNNKWKNPKYGINSTEDNKPYLTSSNKITYDPIIDRKTFDDVQDKMYNSRTNVDKETRHTTILSKLIKCPSCGRYLGAEYRVNNGKDVNSYRCGSRNYSTPCDSKNLSISMNLIDSSVWSLIKADLPILSEKIKQINPNYELAEIEYQIGNIINKQNELKKEIDFCYYKINGIKSKDEKAMEVVDNQNKQIENLQKQQKKLENEKVKLTTRKTQVNEKNRDIEYIIKSNLNDIENSKELLKKYINSFISGINIIEHKTTYTILEIELIDYSTPNIFYKMDELNGSETKMINYLIIDKRTTRHIKLLCEKTPKIIMDINRIRQYMRENVLNRVINGMLKNEITTSQKIVYTKLNISTDK